MIILQIKRENSTYGNMKWLLIYGNDQNEGCSRQWYKTKQEADCALDLILNHCQRGLNTRGVEYIVK